MPLEQQRCSIVAVAAAGWGRIQVAGRVRGARTGPGTSRAAPRAGELFIEVLTSYELAEIARVSEGYDVGLALTPIRA
jgi:hypothetical protein